MDKLVQKCLVPGCELLTDNPQVIFFDFPTTDRDQIRVWNKALGYRANCKHIPDPKVCEHHFEEADIDKTCSPAQLIGNAVPSIGIISSAIPLANESASGVTSAMDGPSYCRLCAKMERAPLKNSIEKMMKCNDTAKLLEICLGADGNNPMFPRGVCDACSHMMKFLIKFVRNCYGAQGRLTKIFTEKSELEETTDLKRESGDIAQGAIKKEVDETNHGLPTDYLEIGLEKEETRALPSYIISDIIDDESKDEHKQEDIDADVKSEPDGIDSDSDYEVKNFHISSPSESDSESDEENYELEDDTSKISNKTTMIKFEDEELANEERPKKRRGRPRKHDPRPPRCPRGPRKPRGSRDKAIEDKPASLCKQICQVCGKILSSSATFNVHMMTHTQQKDIVCPICDKRFYVKQQLKIHIESIHEKKDFVCSICGLKCRWRKSLRRHMLLHDDNPYKHKCTYCDKAFARPNQLRYHVMKHTGDRVYCEICGADYRFNYMLTQHKIRKHGIVVEGVQLYKQSARKKKSEVGESNPRRNRPAADQPTNPELQQALAPPTASSMHPLTMHDHDRTNQSDLTHVSDLGSPATSASFATIASPEPPHFPNHPHPLLQQQTQLHHQQQPQHHHLQQTPPTQLGGFNGAGLNMAMPPGLIGFPTMGRP
ncbi:zinc finger protein weckle-like [Topomyia yanbarensis]|uniref:zinc finger protein weckle-like n=1 Tax=Topomyia yanbarensis TaxID=2498891 RepID=UPI00273B34BF|nr:zinc finger protein weckle-like [Topomyia yanbarensis]